MSFDNLSDFLAMGGHGLYVWSSFALGLLILIGNVLLPWLKLKATCNQLQREYRRQANQKTPASASDT